VIFDDTFETVPSLNPSTSVIDDKFATLFDSPSRDFYLDQISENDDVSFPTLDASWNDVPTASEGANDVSEGVNDAPEGAHESFNFNNPSHLTRQSRSTCNHAPTYSVVATIIAATLPLAQALHTWADLPADIMNNPDLSPSFKPTNHLTYRALAESSLITSSWTNVASAFTAGLSGTSLLSPHLFNPDSEDKGLTDAHNQHIMSLFEPDLSLSDSDDFSPASILPLAFSAKSSANPEDNPSYDEAMNGIYKHKYTEAARVELNTLQTDLDCWELVNVLPSTWAFKCKRFPDGRVKKFKARFCARGDRQKEGID
jgi:hypothetical protein